MEIGLLKSEQRNKDTIGFPQMSVSDMLAAINREDQKVAIAVQAALPQIEKAIDLILPRMKQGGRIVYMGAGTSGRLGIMDAAECRPTYGVSTDRVTGLIAGGKDAIFNAKENSEDLAEQGAEDLKTLGLTALDTVVAAAASGRTPYCIGGLDYARSIGAGTVAVSCNPNAIISHHADVGIEVETGAEVIMGSTRMKAGTAQKMVFNMLSTVCMVRLGRTYDNLMVCLKCKNEKISNRIVRLFCEATGCTSKEEAQKYLSLVDGRLDAAVLLQMTKAEPSRVLEALNETENIYDALKKLP